MRVLVVHDTRAMRTIVTRALRRMEEVQRVIQADSAESAIELLEQEQVDLLLCDWNLRGMTGIEFLEALRAAQWSLPFGIVTGAPSDLVRQRAAASGASFVLHRPFSEDELYSALATLSGGGQSALGYRGASKPIPTWGDGVGTDAAAFRARQLQELLAKLCGMTVEVTSSEIGPDSHSPRHVATYHDPDGQVSALCILATALGLATSASLTRSSPKAALAWARSGIMPAELLEDLYEVANVLGQFVRGDGIHVDLHGIEGFAPGESIEAMRDIGPTATVEHFDVAVVGYCGGLCTVVAR